MLSKKIRALADEAWAQGEKDVSTDLHQIARNLEASRRPLDRKGIDPTWWNEEYDSSRSPWE